RRRRLTQLRSLLARRYHLPDAHRQAALWGGSGESPDPRRPEQTELSIAVKGKPGNSPLDRRSTAQGRASQPAAALSGAVGVSVRPAPPEPRLPQREPPAVAGTQPGAALAGGVFDIGGDGGIVAGSRFLIGLFTGSCP